MTDTRPVQDQDDTQCFYWYPRLASRCKRKITMVADYGFSGMASCEQHGGKMLNWCLEDSSYVKVYTVQAWVKKRERELL